MLKLSLKCSTSKFFQGRRLELADHSFVQRSCRNVTPDEVDMSEGRRLRENSTKVSGVFRLRTVSLRGCVGLTSSSFFSASLQPPPSEELSAPNNKETWRLKRELISRNLRYPEGRGWGLPGHELTGAREMWLSCASQLCPCPGDREGNQFQWETLQRFSPCFHSRG